MGVETKHEMNFRTNTTLPVFNWYQGKSALGDMWSLNSLKASEILYERNIKLAEDERKREEKKCLELSMQNEDLMKERDKAVQENLTEVAMNHDLSMDKDRLQREYDRLLKDQQREMEVTKRDFIQILLQKELEHEKVLLNERSKATEIKKNLDKQVDELKVEIVELNEEVGRKTVEITKIEADHSERFIESENRLRTEYEVKIKKIQADHDQEIAERELEEAKLSQDRKLLKSDADTMDHDHEKDLLQHNHEHKQVVEDAIEEVNNKWRNKYMQLERESENKERGHRNEISHLENKRRDDLKEKDGRWQLTLSQKQNEIDFVKESLEKNLVEANQKISASEAKFFREKLQLKNEAEMKLNEKVKELNVEFKKNLDEKVDTLTSNLKYEMGEKEKDHQYKIQRKDMELATMEESLARAQRRNNEIENNLRTIDRKITKDQIQKLTEEKTDKYTSMKKQMHERKQSRSFFH